MSQTTSDAPLATNGAEWDQHRENIEFLFLAEKRPLEGVREIMSRKFKFKKTYLSAPPDNASKYTDCMKQTAIREATSEMGYSQKSKRRCMEGGHLECTIQATTRERERGLPGRQAGLTREVKETSCPLRAIRNDCAGYWLYTLILRIPLDWLLILF